jgi:hypothetical protein
MAKADRVERMDDRRVEVEADYRAILIAALRRTASGKWGLFGQNRDWAARGAVGPTLASLEEAAAEIDAIRARLKMEPFALHPEFLASRGPVSANAPGEPKQALLWLEKLGASLDSGDDDAIPPER